MRRRSPRIGRSILNLPEEVLENILWRITKARHAAACELVCKRWATIFRKSPVLELAFDDRSRGREGHVDIRIRRDENLSRLIRRIEAVIGSVLNRHHPGALRELSIIFKQRTDMEGRTLSQDRIERWLSPVAQGLEILRIKIEGFNVCRLIDFRHLKKLLVSRCFLRQISQNSWNATSLRLCLLEEVMFETPLNQLLSACPCLETLILNRCGTYSTPSIEISSQSLLRLYIVQVQRGAIVLDTPKLELLALKAIPRRGVERFVSASERTKVKFLLLMSPVQLQFKAGVVLQAGDEWKFPDVIPSLPSVKVMFGAMYDDAEEELRAWLAMFELDLQVFQGPMRFEDSRRALGWITR